MPGRIFLAVALAACIGGAALADESGGIVFKTPAGAGAALPHGVGTWSWAPVREAGEFGARGGRDRRDLFGGTVGGSRVLRSRIRSTRSRVATLRGHDAGVRVVGATTHGHHDLRPPRLRRGRHQGVHVAGVNDLDFGIDDHRHDHDRGVVRPHRQYDAFRVPEHRFLQDRFTAPDHRFDGRRKFRRQLGGGHRFDHRPARPRRLRCSVAVGASVLAFC